MKLTRRDILKSTPLAILGTSLGSTSFGSAAAAASPPFGEKFPELESLTTGEWWKVKSTAIAPGAKKNQIDGPAAPDMNVPRDEVVCFACYTLQNGVLKMTAQL